MNALFDSDKLLWLAFRGHTYVYANVLATSAESIGTEFYNLSNISYIGIWHLRQWAAQGHNEWLNIYRLRLLETHSSSRFK